jgi:hypothetical protein
MVSEITSKQSNADQVEIQGSAARAAASAAINAAANPDKLLRGLLQDIATYELYSGQEARLEADNKEKMDFLRNRIQKNFMLFAPGLIPKEIQRKIIEILLL